MDLGGTLSVSHCPQSSNTSILATSPQRLHLVWVFAQSGFIAPRVGRGRWTSSGPGCERTAWQTCPSGSSTPPAETAALPGSSGCSASPACEGPKNSKWLRQGIQDVDFWHGRYFQSKGIVKARMGWFWKVHHLTQSDRDVQYRQNVNYSSKSQVTVEEKTQALSQVATKFQASWVKSISRKKSQSHNITFFFSIS